MTRTVKVQTYIEDEKGIIHPWIEGTPIEVDDDDPCGDVIEFCWYYEDTAAYNEEFKKRAQKIYLADPRKSCETK